MGTIGLIAAMAEEIRPLLRRAGKWERVGCGAFRCYRFQISAMDCLLVESGIGPTRAAAAARALLSLVTPRLLVSFGIAGAVEADLRIGDVIIAGKACLLEDGSPEHPLPLAPLPEAAQTAAGRALEPSGAHLYPGTTITTRGSQVVLGGPGKLVHPVLEMETAAIARIAADRGIPLLALRSISDNPGEPIPINLEGWYDEEYHLVIPKVIRVILGNPRLLPQLLKLYQNSRKAEQNLAVALMAVLDHLPAA
jgi:adenosylhomocysteine nucleosidase